MNAKNRNPNTPRLWVAEEGGIRTISIDSPGKRNAMTLEMWEALVNEIELANADPDTKVVVLSGVGDRAFTSGADISEFAAKRSTLTQIEYYDEVIDRAQHGLSASAKPTVALIRGICMGGGMEIAAACDLRYANVSATFRMPAGRVGVGYSLHGMARMVDILGAATTQDVFLTGRIFDGAEAARIGFVNEVFPDNDFGSLSNARVTALAENAPLTLSAVKIAVRHLLGRVECPSAEQVDAAVAACFSSEDYREGQVAFREKRKPAFKGR